LNVESYTAVRCRAASWLTAIVVPAIVSVPDRADPEELVGDVGSGLGATENDTLPLSRPVLPDVIVRKASLLLAVQVQPAACDATVPFPGRLRRRTRRSRG
jgi:hypothetical protein